MLFSEPKIPHLWWIRQKSPRPLFQCSSASRKFLTYVDRNALLIRDGFSALQRAENSSPRSSQSVGVRCKVSVLFSEPKIPHAELFRNDCGGVGGFSALQRAENSSQRLRSVQVFWNDLFQCSSASRKFLTFDLARQREMPKRFSALQRAENSSLNTNIGVCAGQRVSVLFSEPKIPHVQRTPRPADAETWFQCSSASRKFLTRNRTRSAARAVRFQCSSASRKFLTYIRQHRRYVREHVSVLFSEPKIPHSRPSHLRPSIFPTAMITLRHS